MLIALSPLLDQLDHFILDGNPSSHPAVVAPTFPSGTFLASGPLQSTYHVSLQLGANSPANGGNGQAVEVLFDTGGSSLPSSSPFLLWLRRARYLSLFTNHDTDSDLQFPAWSLTTRFITNN